MMELDALIATSHAEMEDLYFHNNSVDTGDEEEGRKMDPVISGPIKNDVSAKNEDSAVTIEWKEASDIFEHSHDSTTRTDDTALLSITSFALKSRNALTDEDKSLQPEKTDEKVTAEEVLSLAMEQRDPQEDNAAGMNTELNELQLDGECWEHINWTENSTEQWATGSSMTGDFSDSSTLCAGSLNVSTYDINSLQSDSWIMQRQLMEPELRSDKTNLVSCDSLSPGIGYMETFHVGTADIRMAPMESLHLSLVSNNNLILGATGTGSSSLSSMNLANLADWNMGSVPVKCLQLGAVNIASLTLGTVGISVIPMVSAGTIDINPFKEKIGMVSMESLEGETISTDSENLVTLYADHVNVNVDSITPEGVRERWHPLEDRLFALGEALTALDKKLEGFSPRLQEAEILLNNMDCSLTQHAMHINDIMIENTALAQRILQLEEQMRGEKQHHLFDRESEEDA